MSILFSPLSGLSMNLLNPNQSLPSSSLNSKRKERNKVRKQKYKLKRKNNNRARKNRIKFHIISSPNVPELGNGRHFNDHPFQPNKEDYFLKLTI